jgi:hypothetical protein
MPEHSGLGFVGEKGNAKLPLPFSPINPCLTQSGFYDKIFLNIKIK